MKILIKFVLLLTVLTSLAVVATPALAFCSDNTPSCGGPSGNTSTGSGNGGQQSGQSSSGSSTATPPPGCDSNATQGQAGYCGQQTTLGNNPNCNNTSASTCLNSIPFIHNDVQAVVDFLSGAVGLIVVGMIIAGGIQYTMAGDNAQAVSAAKTRITNGLIALFVFLFLFAFIQWLIPGGIFG